MLHIIRQSGFSSDALSLCLATLNENDDILLIDDGCYNLQHTELQHKLPRRCDLYYLDSHAQARAVIDINNIAKTISIDDVCKLVFLHHNSVTW